jgi:transcription initiation factor TFIID subunit 12
MYTPAQIRSMTTLSEEEKTKYVQGLEALYSKAQNSPADSVEARQAMEKISSFSQMLTNKNLQRRAQFEQRQQQLQQQQQQQQGQQGQQQNPQMQQGQQQRPQPPQPGQPTQQQAQLTQAQAQAQARTAIAQQQKLAGQAANQAQGQQGAGPNPGQVQNGAARAGGTQPGAQAPGALKLPEAIAMHLRQISFKPPQSILDKSTADAQKWVTDMKNKYGRALLTVDNAKTKVRAIERQIAQRAQEGNPFSEEDLKKLNDQKAQQIKLTSDANKWVEQVRKTHIVNVGDPNAAAAAAAGASTPGQKTDGSQANAGATQAAPQANAAASVNAAMEAAKNQQSMAAAAAAAGRASPATGGQVPARPPVQQPQQQPQATKPEPPNPAPVNTALANQAAAPAATPAQNAARVQTPQQTSTPVTATGPTRALSHSAAMTLANQRAANTPGSAPGQSQQQGVGTPSSAGPMANPIASAGAPQQQMNQQQQQGVAAQPTQQQAAIQSKMPIPKQLPEKATAVPQGVTIGGGINTGRPTMSQGSGTLGGVMNQPAINRIPAYNHESEGDHVLSKKKLDELVRQVCAGSSEGQEGNLLTPEVEEVSSHAFTMSSYHGANGVQLECTQHGRFVRGQRPACCLSKCEGARLQGSGDS